MEERLKKIRENLGKTQKEMSALLGLGEITWQNYERGISKPKLATLEKLTSQGYSISWITTGNGDMFNNQISENSAPSFSQSNNIDKSKIFNLILNELKKIYTDENLKSRDENFLPGKAFDMTMNIISVAEDSVSAVNMIKLVLLQEENNKKGV